MADQNLSSLLDRENNQLLKPIATFTQTGIRVPEELLDEDSVVIKVYTQLVKLANGKDGQTVVLPPRPEIAAMCRCNHHTYVAAELRLHELGWITIQNLNQPGKSTRRRIVVKILETFLFDGHSAREIIESITQMIKGGGEKISNFVKGNDLPLHNMYSSTPDTSSGQFPPELHDLKSRCKNADVNGLTLAQISDPVLLDMSGGASNSDIETGIREVESFKPFGNKKIFSISKAFSKRFKNGKLDPERKGKLFDSRKQAGKKTSPEVSDFLIRARELKSPIYPDDFHPPEEVDRICKKLNGFDWTERGALPLSLMRLWNHIPDLLVVNIEEHAHLVKLHDNAQFIEVKPGYWSYTLEVSSKNSTSNRERSWSKHPKGIGDAMKPIIQHQSSNRLS